MPRFVLLHHRCPESFDKETHWDFLLETGEALAAWNLFKLPSAWHEVLELRGEPTAESAVDAHRLADHRLAYLDYQGTVSNNRGEVVRLDRGEYMLHKADDDHFRVTLRGEKLSGELLLQRQSGDRWRLVLL